MKKRNLKPTQTALVERPQAGITSRDPLAMFVASGGGVGAMSIKHKKGDEEYYL